MKSRTKHRLRALVTASSLIFPACYLSTPPAGFYADGRPDMTPGDPLPDDVQGEDAGDVSPDEDAEPVSYRFVDRDIPDRNIPVRLLFASTPSLAWNGSSAAVVYSGMESGDGQRVGFIPLDARGNVAGDETILMDGGGIETSIPMLSASDEGDFLFCTLTEAGGDQIAVARISPAGQVLSRGSSPVSSNIIGPLSPPVKVGSFVYAAAENYAPGDEGVEIYRFTWPDLDYDTKILVPDGPGVHRFSPSLIGSPGSTDLLLFFTYFTGYDPFLWYEEYSSGLEYVTVEGPLDSAFSVYSYSAASNSDRWTAWYFNFDYGGSTFTLKSLDSLGNAMSGGDQAESYCPFMASDAADFPAWGAVFSVYLLGRWDVWIEIQALPEPLYGVGAFISASDEDDEDNLDEMHWPDIAWTDWGFLVVWNEWRADYTYSLFSSFIALEAEY